MTIVSMRKVSTGILEGKYGHCPRSANQGLYRRSDLDATTVYGPGDRNYRLWPGGSVGTWKMLHCHLLYAGKTQSKTLAFHTQCTASCILALKIGYVPVTTLVQGVLPYTGKGGCWTRLAGQGKGMNGTVFRDKAIVITLFCIGTRQYVCMALFFFLRGEGQGRVSTTGAWCCYAPLPYIGQGGVSTTGAWCW